MIGRGSGRRRVPQGRHPAKGFLLLPPLPAIQLRKTNMTSASKPAKPTRKVALPPPPRFDIHQEARPKANHAASGILEVAAHNSSRRVAAETARSGQKPASPCWPEI